MAFGERARKEAGVPLNDCIFFNPWSQWVKNSTKSKYTVLFLSAPFFVECISEQDLDEMNIEIIRNTLYKVS